MSQLREYLLKLFWDNLHTVTFAHDSEPNEPHRQVIFKEEIPGIVDTILEKIEESHKKDLENMERMEIVECCDNCKQPFESFEVAGGDTGWGYVFVDPKPERKKGKLYWCVSCIEKEAENGKN